MNKKFKSLSALFMAAVLILSLAAPVFASTNCLPKKKAEITVNVKWNGDDAWVDYGIRLAGAEIVLKNDGQQVGEPKFVTVDTGDQPLTWKLGVCDSWKSDAFSVECTAPGGDDGWYVCNVVEDDVESESLWLGDSEDVVSEDIASEDVDLEDIDLDDVEFDDTVLEEEAVDEELLECGKPKDSCWKECSDCHKKYDCTKEDDCKIHRGWKTCKDCGKKYHPCKRHKCCPKPKPECDYEEYEFDVDLTLKTGTLKVVKTVSGDLAIATDEFAFAVTATLPNEEIYPIDVFSLNGGDKNTKTITLPIGTKYAVEETDSKDYKVVYSQNYTGEIDGEVEVGVVNTKSSTPTPDPDPPHHGGGGGSAVVSTGPAATEVAEEPAPIEFAEAPKTGMPAEYFVWLAVMILSAGTIAVVLFRKNREEA